MSLSIKNKSVVLCRPRTSVIFSRINKSTLLSLFFYIYLSNDSVYNCQSILSLIFKKNNYND